MKIEWLVTNVTAVRSPDRAERASLKVVLAGRFFWTNSGRICGRGVTLWCGNTILSSNNFTYDHLMKIEWFVTDETAVGSPNRAERAILGVILGVFWSIQAVFVVREPLYDVGIPY